MLRGGVTSFYNADALGSVTSLSNSAGAVAQTYTFDSFGKQTASSGSLTNPFRYTAREFDTETGLYFYRARYYDSAAGRFLSEDAFGPNSDDLDFYSYVRNSPVGYTDPLGYGRTHQCGPRCGFRLDTNDPFKGPSINWWCNGLKGCLMWPSLQPCEVSKSDPVPNRIRDCIKEKLPAKNTKPCQKTDFEIQKDVESTQDMVKFWEWILIGDAVAGVVGVAGAFGWLGGGAAGAGAGTAPKPINFPKPAPQPIPVRPAA
jgi:RHS repeat-associated protein